MPTIEKTVAAITRSFAVCCHQGGKWKHFSCLGWDAREWDHWSAETPRLYCCKADALAQWSLTARWFIELRRITWTSCHFIFRLPSAGHWVHWARLLEELTKIGLKDLDWAFWNSLWDQLPDDRQRLELAMQFKNCVERHVSFKTTQQNFFAFPFKS